MSSTIKIACFGDVVSKTGIAALRRFLGDYRKTHNPDLVIANGENSAGGVGLDVASAKDLRSAGVDLLTLGDHTWSKKDINLVLNGEVDKIPKVIRPANYPVGAPGKGYDIVELADGVKIGVINLIGRIFFNFSLDCPFRKTEAILEEIQSKTNIIVVDLHAEATSEKYAMGRFLDGKVSLLFGTHTHVQTADDQILPGGSAYITDLGMTGASDGVIGMDAEVATERFLTGMPSSYKPAKELPLVQGVFVEVDKTSGKALSIERIRACVKI